MAELIQKTDTLDKGRIKLNEAIKDADKAKADAGAAVNTSNQAKQIAQTAEHKADSVQAQFDQVVIEGDSSVEAAQARVDTDGNPHTTLKARLDSEHTQVTAQLAVTKEDIISRGKNFLDFKPTLDGTTPVTEKLEEAISYLKNQAEEIPGLPGVKKHLNTLILPPGTFVVDDTINLFEIYGFTIKGAGRLQTKIKFTGVNKDMFYLNRAGWIKFEELTLESEVDNNATAIHMHMEIPNDNGKPTYQIDFDRCNITGFYKGVHTTGNEMCSEHFYQKTRFLNCYHAFVIENEQSLNFQLVGCDIENGEMVTSKEMEGSTAFWIRKGGMINMFGGSLIIHGTTLYVDYAAQHVIKRFSAGLINFQGVRWEFFNSGDKNVVLRSSGQHINQNDMSVNIKDSILYQRENSLNSPLSFLYNNIQMSVDNTMINSGQIIGIIEPGTASTYGSLICKNTNKVDYKERRDTTTTNQPTVVHRVVVENGNFNTGIGGVLDFELTPRHSAVKSLKRVFYSDLFGSIPANAGSATLSIPINSIAVRAIISRKEAGGADSTYTVKSGDGLKTYGSKEISFQGGYAYIDLGEFITDETTKDFVFEVTGSTAMPVGFFAIEYF